ECINRDAIDRDRTDPSARPAVTSDAKGTARDERLRTRGETVARGGGIYLHGKGWLRKAVERDVGACVGTSRLIAKAEPVIASWKSESTSADEGIVNEHPPANPRSALQSVIVILRRVKRRQDIQLYVLHLPRAEPKVELLRPG